jgi:hypothetical protein
VIREVIVKISPSLVNEGLEHSNRLDRGKFDGQQGFHLFVDKPGGTFGVQSIDEIHESGI